MVGLTKHCRNPDLAWELAQHLYLDKPELAERFRMTNILPPLREAWDLPAFKEPRPYWSNQPIGTMYAALADQVPPQYTSPFITLAKTKLSEALVECVQYYRQRGEDGFLSFVQATLHHKAEEVRKVMRRSEPIMED